MKYQYSSKNHSLISGIYKATYENAKLVDLLSLDTVLKMESSFNERHVHPAQKAVILKGQRNKAVEFIKEWLLENLKNKITVIDPCFSEKNLDLVKLIQSVSANCQVVILCSKENSLNCHENNEQVYNSSWEQISLEPPPDTLIQLVWDSQKKSPFPNICLICDDVQTGLKLGTSYGYLGLEDEAQIVVISSDEVMQIEQTIINDFFVKRIRMLQDLKLNYSSFALMAD